jgi:hypothetical protein
LNGNALATPHHREMATDFLNAMQMTLRFWLNLDSPTIVYQSNGRVSSRKKACTTNLQ